MSCADAAATSRFSWREQYELDFSAITGSGIHTFTPEHKQKNRLVMQAVEDILPLKDINKTNDCDMIYRYLIARHWDVELAAKSIREYIQWRAEERIDEVMWEPVAPRVSETVASFYGVDKEGYPLLWDAPNPKLVVEVLKSTSKEEMLRAHYKMMESARYLSRTNGVDRISYVLDLTLVTVSSVTSESIGILKEMSKKDQTYYPEVMRRMLICNGGWAVTAAWKVIRPLLDERVQKKIQFLKDAPSVVTLQEFIEAESIRHKYGGGGKGLCGKSQTTLEAQLACATESQPVGSLRALATSPDTGLSRPQVRCTTGYDSEEDANDMSTSESSPSSVLPRNRTRVMQPDSSDDDDRFYSLSDTDDPIGGGGDDASPAAAAMVGPSTPLSTTVIGTPSAVQRASATPHASPAVVLTVPVIRKGRATTQTSSGQTEEVPANNTTQPPAPLISAAAVATKTATAPKATTSSGFSFGSCLQGPSELQPRKGHRDGRVLTPGRFGDGVAVEIELEQYGKNVRGFHQERLIGESQDNLVMGFVSDASLCSDSHLMPSRSAFATAELTAAAAVGGSGKAGKADVRMQSSFGSKVLIGELLRESGHPLHTHLIISDANRVAKFILMQRNFHKQVVIYQVIGDARVQTSKSFKHSVPGEKVKMARCGERDDSDSDADWVVWGKVRVGTKEVRKYLAERQGSTLLFYDALASLSIHDLFCLSVGLIDLWDK